MNYRYSYSMVRKREQQNPAGMDSRIHHWPLGVGCVEDGDCAGGGICAQGQCAADCGTPGTAVGTLLDEGDSSQFDEGYIRLSRGLNPPLVHFEAHETAPSPAELPDRLYAAHLACAAVGPTFCGCSANPLPAQCGPEQIAPGTPEASWDGANGAWVDYDQDGQVTPAAVFAPVMGAGTNTADCQWDAVLQPAEDNNDWMQIYRLGRDGLDKETRADRGDMIIYFSRMHGDAEDRWTGHSAPLSTPALYGDSGFGPGLVNWGYALEVDNSDPPHDQSYLRFDSHPRWESMGTTIEGRAPKGFTVRLQFRVDSFDHGDSQTLIANDLFHVHVPNHTKQVSLSLHSGQSWLPEVINPLEIEEGLWYALAFRWERSESGPSENVFVDVSRQRTDPPNGEFLDDVGARLCVKSLRVATSNQAVGETRLGATAGSPRGLTGAIDHVVIKNFPHREWQRGSNDCDANP